MNAIKFLDSGEIEGLAIPFGGPERLDRQGEWFGPETDFGLDLIEGPRPLLLEHGLGPAGPAVVGRVVAIERRPEGLWVKAIVDRAGRWFEQVKALLARGALGFSSGTLAHLVKMGPGGAILQWPFVELSLTATPASLDAAVYTIKTADLAAHRAALARVRSVDRDELRLIRARLAGQKPHRGLATAGMDGALVIQREAEVRHG